MNKSELLQRTKNFAIRVLRLLDKIPGTSSTKIISGQLGRSATSIAANYRAACRGRSRAEFISRIGIGEEESDESQFWIELLLELFPKDEELKYLLKEATELTAIFTATGRSAKLKKGFPTA